MGGWESDERVRKQGERGGVWGTSEKMCLLTIVLYLVLVPRFPSGEFLL